MRPTYLPAVTRRRICPLHGKRRFRDENQAKVVVENARFQRRRIAREKALYGSMLCETVVVRRRECRCYQCTVCGGWHTTSRA